MTKKLDAIYENGSFFPINGADLFLSDGACVRLTVEPITQETGMNVLDLAAKVYAGLSDEDVVDVEKIATDRMSHFSRIPELVMRNWLST